MRSVNNEDGIKKETKLVKGKSNSVAREIELSVIGQELHDNINQVLGTVKLLLEVAQTSRKRRTEMLNRSKELIGYCINEVRQLSRSIIVQELSGDEFNEAVKRLLTDVADAGNLKTDFAISEKLKDKIGKQQKIMLFRIIQEQVNNVLKYARATCLIIRLQEADGWIELYIYDNGVGFNMAQVKPGVGFTSMRQRAERYQGEVNIISQEEQGTKVIIKIPEKNII